ncbi:peptidase U35 [Sphingomonas changnyeongensis]|uniref:Peptidase U35 n=1 Tax=Sphingomonas changnyeongensis TaxID=2698679 RepID=A0A7Z2S619_9SPHN|nr:Mu-like prophage major head subunit gpT family protein [Sphingomonas changnyeongensis]QHL90988.1 peptidase U35 [Sphingomonas changnyeongensis]
MLGRHEATPYTPEGLMAEIGRRYAQRDMGAPQFNRVTSEQPPAARLQARMADALYARMSGSEPSDQAREFMNMSLPRMARALLEEAGERTSHMSDFQAVEAAMRSQHTTSDFSNLMVQSGNRYLSDVFESAQSSLIQLARLRQDIPDFRRISSIEVSEFGTLPKVNEGGEIKHGTFRERAEGYQAETFGKIFGLSIQAIVNDTLGAFSDPLRIMARAAAETQAAQLVSLITANSGNGGLMADGLTLFHASRGNRAATGASISVSSLSEARTAMRQQKDVSGEVFMNVRPRFVVVGADQETAAEQFVMTINPSNSAQVNPHAGRYEVLVDPRLPLTQWRLFADPAVAPVLEHGYVNGYEGPQLAMREGFNILGNEYRVSMHWGCGLIDFRGAFLNPGA